MERTLAGLRGLTTPPPLSLALPTVCAVLEVLKVANLLSLPTIAAALVAGGVGWVRTRRRAAVERRHAVAADVIEAVRATVSRQTSLARYWSPPTPVEFASLYLRLQLELEGREEPVAHRVLRQVQRMLASSSDADQLQLGSDVAKHLVRWQRREIGSEWFARELASDPVHQRFRVPRTTRVRRFGQQFKLGLAVSFLLASVLWMSKQVLR